MGIHLPFVGYVKARGASTVRHDQHSGLNAERIQSIRELFAALEQVPLSVFRPFRPNPDEVVEGANFRDILFETDVYCRPALRTFIDRARPKSLVIPSREDLFEVENEIVDDFAKKAERTYIPILCLDDPLHPLSPALLRAAGDELPFLLMGNQRSVAQFIRNRFAQIGGARH